MENSPPEFRYLKALETLDLSYMLMLILGAVPVELGFLDRLESVDLEAKIWTTLFLHFWATVLPLTFHI